MIDQAPSYTRESLDGFLVGIVADLYDRGILAAAHDGILQLNRWPNLYDAPFDVQMTFRRCIAAGHVRAGNGDRRFYPCWRHQSASLAGMCIGMTPAEVAAEPDGTCSVVSR